MKLLFLHILFLLTILSSVQAQRGRVQIQNGTLVTDKGTLLRSAFVAINDSRFKMPPRENVTAIKNLGLNCIHVYAESYWDENRNGAGPGYLSDELDSLVKWTKVDSLYLILTFAGLDIDNINNVDFAKECWDIYSERYKNETHVVYEIFSEPGEVPFDPRIIALERDCYQIIRSHAPETHILLMSPWNIFYDGFLSDISKLGGGIDWSNASIASHVYQKPAQDNIEPIKRIKNAGYAITITEFHSFENEYANLACTRVFEKEFVSYTHFLDVNAIVVNPSVFKSRVESSEVRWTPDFGIWPENITEIKYEKPYKMWPAIFYDKGSGFQNDFTKIEIEYITNNSFIAYYNIDFEEGPETFSAYCASPYGAGTIQLHLDSLKGPLVGTCTVGNTGDWEVYQPFSCEITQPFNGVHNIYLVFEAGINLKFWFFNKSELLSPQTPYNGVVSVLPGKIEAENYDVGGLNVSFFDNTQGNDGNAFRNDDVDIDKIGNEGYCVGWTNNGEWLEYTIRCEQEISMDVQFRMACTLPEDKIKLKLNNQELATVYLPNTGGFWNYQTVTVNNIRITKGENQILRLEFLGNFFNLDWLNFVESSVTGIDEVDSRELITFYPNPAKDYIQINANGNVTVKIFNMQGQLLKMKQINLQDNLIPVNDLPLGSYIIRIFNEAKVQSEILIIE